MLCGRIASIASYLEAISPEQLVEFLRQWATRSEKAVFEFGGHLVRLEGPCFLAAWESPRNGVAEITEAVCRAALSITNAAMPCQDWSPSPRLVLAVVVGTCVYQMKGGAISLVLGEPVSRVEEMAAHVEPSRSCVLVDESVDLAMLPWRTEVLEGHRALVG